MLRRTFLNGLAFLPALLGFRNQEIPQQLQEVTQGNVKLLVDLVNNYIVRSITPGPENRYYVAWFDKQGLLHNENGPAREDPHGKQEWMIHGNYRTDAPAITYRDGKKYACIPCSDNGGWLKNEVPLGHDRFQLYPHHDIADCDLIYFATKVQVKKIWLKTPCVSLARDNISKIEDVEGNVYLSVPDTQGIFHHFQKV